MKSYFNKFPDILRQTAVFLFLLVIVLLVYAPVFQGHYFQGEDYSGTWVSTWTAHSNKSFLSFERDFPFEGRILKDLYLYLTFVKYINPLKSVEAGNIVRLFGVISVGVFAYILYLLFSNNGFKSHRAIFMSILICTLPPVQIYVGRIAITIFIYSAILAALASFIALKVFINENYRKKLTILVSSGLAAVILLVFGLHIYQPGVMLFWTLALIPLLVMQDEHFTKKRYISFISYFSIGVLAIVVYFVITKLLIILLHTTNVTISNRGGVIDLADVPSRALEFIKNPLYTSLNLWNTFPSKLIGLSVSAIIVAGFACSIRGALLKRTEKQQGINPLWKHILILIIVPLSYLSNLLIKEGVTEMIPKFRILVGLEIAIVLLLYWGFINVVDFLKSSLNFSAHLKERIITIAMIALTVTAAFAANHNVDKFVTLHTGELRYVKNAIQEYGVSNLSKDSKIYIISSDKDATKYFSEFTYLTSRFRSSIYMGRLALYELGADADILVEFVDYNEEPDTQLPQDKNRLIIDMRDYQKDAYKELSIPTSIQPLI